MAMIIKYRSLSVSSLVVALGGVLLSHIGSVRADSAADAAAASENAATSPGSPAEDAKRDAPAAEPTPGVATWCSAWIGSETGVGARCDTIGVWFRAIATCIENSGDPYYSFGPWLNNAETSTAWCAEGSFASEARVEVQ